MTLSLSTVIAKGGRDAAGPGTGALRQARASLFCCCIAVQFPQNRLENEKVMDTVTHATSSALLRPGLL